MKRLQFILASALTTALFSGSLEAKAESGNFGNPVSYYSDISARQSIFYTGHRHFNDRDYESSIRYFRQAAEIAKTSDPVDEADYTETLLALAHSLRFRAYKFPNPVIRQRYYFEALDTYRGLADEYRKLQKNPKYVELAQERLLDMDLFMASCYFGIGDIDNGTRFALIGLRNNPEKSNINFIASMIEEEEDSVRKAIIARFSSEMGEETSRAIELALKKRNGQR